MIDRFRGRRGYNSENLYPTPRDIVIGITDEILLIESDIRYTGKPGLNLLSSGIIWQGSSSEYTMTALDREAERIRLGALL
jgi:hypothetical protein